MAGDGRIIVQSTKPPQKKGEETLSMKVARYLDPVLRNPQSSLPPDPSGSPAGESLSQEVDRRLEKALRSSHPPPPAVSSRSPPEFRSYRTMAPESLVVQQDDKPTIADVNEAINKRDLELLIDLERRGAPLDEPDRNGWTPLANAISNGCTDIADHIIAQGANHRMKIGAWSYLMLAAVGNRMRIGKRLLESGGYPRRDVEEAAKAAEENGYSEFAFMMKRHLKGG